MPNLSGLINEREVAICRRLADLRSSLGLTQIHIANILGITRAQWAALEYATTPLRYWLADRFCQTFDVCQQWLAIGDGPTLGYVKIPIQISIQIRRRQLFSAVYDWWVGRVVAERLQDAEAISRAISQQVGNAEKLLYDRLYNLAVCWFQRIPPHLYDEYFRQLMAASAEFFKLNRHRFGSDTWPPPVLPEAKHLAKNIFKAELTGVTLERKTERMTEMQLLLQRLKRALEGVKKGDLARSLKVPLPRVSEWLSGRVMPSGETTLRLLDWVQAQEAKPKSPASVQPPAGQKTQVPKLTKYEKRNSCQKKR